MTTKVIAPQQRIINTENALGYVGVSLTTYVVAELIHHGLFEAYVLPWLISTGLSASMAAYITWALVALSVAALAWIIWKFLIAQEE